MALLERAGDAARQGFDDDAAVRWYRAALERGRQALTEGAGDELAQIRLALKLALVHALSRRGGGVGERCCARRSSWRRRAAIAGPRCRRGAAWRGWRRSGRTSTAAREHLTLALQASLAGGDAATLAELYLELSDVLRAPRATLQGAERELWEGLMLVTAGDGPEAERGPEPMWRLLLALGELARARGATSRARARTRCTRSGTPSASTAPSARARAYTSSPRSTRRWG